MHVRIHMELGDVSTMCTRRQVLHHCLEDCEGETGRILARVKFHVKAAKRFEAVRVRMPTGGSVRHSLSIATCNPVAWSSNIGGVQ